MNTKKPQKNHDLAKENEDHKKKYEDLKQENNALNHQIQEIQQKYDELKDTLQRLQAEFENYRKRTEEDKSRFVTIANKELIQKIIPILDNLEMALFSTEEKTAFYKGIELIYSQIKEILHNEGVTEINTQGKFDPKIHEALIAVESDNEPGTILEELQKGYKINDTIIRHAKVKIAKGGN